MNDYEKNITYLKRAIKNVASMPAFPLVDISDYKAYAKSKSRSKLAVQYIDPLRLLYMILHMMEGDGAKV